jgi:hypothetical protein
MEPTVEELRQKAIKRLAAGLEIEPELITEHDGSYHWGAGMPTWRSTRYEDGTPLWEWTCPRCGDTGAATGASLAYLHFRAYHWKSAKCTRRMREAL